MANWHYDHQGQPTGPVSDDDLRALVEDGTVTADTRVWTSGMADWQVAATAVPHLFDLPSVPDVPETAPEASFGPEDVAAPESAAAPEDARTSDLDFSAPFDPAPDAFADPAPAALPDPEPLPEPTFDPTPEPFYNPTPTFDPTPEATFDPLPEATFDPAPRPAPTPEPTFDPVPEPAYAPAPEPARYEPAPAAAPPQGPLWHYERAGQPAGPVPEDELALLAQSGVVTASTRVWTEGMPDWQSARTALPALFGSTAVATLGAPASTPSAFAGTSAAVTGPYVEPGWMDFSGRIRRKTFGIRSLIFAVVATLGLVPLYLATESQFAVQMAGYALSLLLLATYAQRFRDLNQSGWLALLSLVPCVGLFAFLYLLFVEGTPGPNQYGPDPKGRG